MNARTGREEPRDMVRSCNEGETRSSLLLREGGVSLSFCFALLCFALDIHFGRTIQNACRQLKIISNGIALIYICFLHVTPRVRSHIQYTPLQTVPNACILAHMKRFMIQKPSLSSELPPGSSQSASPWSRRIRHTSTTTTIRRPRHLSRETTVIQQPRSRRR